MKRKDLHDSESGYAPDGERSVELPRLEHTTYTADTCAGLPSGGRSEIEMAESAAPDALWQYVRSEDYVVRIAAASNPRVSRSQLDALSKDKDWQVRWTLASLPYSGMGELVANDPNPIVRLAASEAWDLPEQIAKKLAEDVDVQRVIAILQR